MKSLSIKSFWKAILIASLTSTSGLALAQEADSREVIWLSGAERAALMSEMRLFLSTSQQILEATLAEDMTKVETLARPVGVKLMKDTPASLKDKLPAGFTQLGPQAHLGFENIADEASGLGDQTIILQQLADLQKSCVACHAQYQIKVRD